jgi:tRNA pseudouridine38-40 synthase
VTLFDPPTPASPAPAVRARALIAYDGSGFHGFAATPGFRTVAGVLRAALERVLGHEVEITVAGRTDRGVHAWGQVISFDARADRFDPVDLRRSLNKLVGPAIAVRELAAAEPGFDARFSAVGRVYRYRICNRPVHDPFLVRTTWHLTTPLDLAALRVAADPLVGTHDFASFCRRPPRDRQPASLVRTVERARWSDCGDGVLQFEIEGRSFCHQMVRSLVGTMAEVGMGRRKAAELVGILAARNRAAAGRLAPPQGLTLWAVRY